MISSVERKKEIKGLAIAKGGTSISHLLFTDDNILFCKGIKEEWGRVKAVLNLFERGSSQVINNQKSSIFFNSNTLIKAQTAMTQEVRGVICGSYDKYLGLPALIGRSKYNTFG